MKSHWTQRVENGEDLTAQMSFVAPGKSFGVHDLPISYLQNRHDKYLPHWVFMMIQQNGRYKNILNDMKSYIIFNNRGEKKEQQE